MGVKFSSIVFVILLLFILKISFENINQAQAVPTTSGRIDERYTKREIR